MLHFVSEINIAAVTLTENVGVISGLSFIKPETRTCQEFNGWRFAKQIPPVS